MRSVVLLPARLEQLDRVARWIVDHNLGTARSLENVTAKMQSGLPQLFHVSREIIDVDDHAVPTARFGRSAVQHWLGRSSRSKRSAEHQLEMSARQHCKIWRDRPFDFEAEVFGVERDSGIDVIHHVADAWGLGIILVTSGHLIPPLT